jgi:hypothetical protein
LHLLTAEVDPVADVFGRKALQRKNTPDSLFSGNIYWWLAQSKPEIAI